ncbi:MAG: hypothetical protein A2Y40_02890 [Candidatus Margulisbacteria bacterium GWF2_35_9]|nr:MAG: hypothetical protein A2Y40_02890 [Candidatus Margulisbacteria bacterium GWF2_35_9]
MNDLCININKRALVLPADLNKDGLICSDDELAIVASNIPNIGDIHKIDTAKLITSIRHFLDIKTIDTSILNPIQTTVMPTSGNAFSPLNSSYWMQSMTNSVDYSAAISENATTEEKLLYMLKEPNSYPAEVFEKMINFYHISAETLAKVINTPIFIGSAIETAAKEKLGLMGN